MPPPVEDNEFPPTDAPLPPPRERTHKAYGACKLTSDQKTLLGAMLGAWRKKGRRSAELLAVLTDAGYSVDRRSLLRWQRHVANGGMAVAPRGAEGRAAAARRAAAQQAKVEAMTVPADGEQEVAMVPQQGAPKGMQY